MLRISSYAGRLPLPSQGALLSELDAAALVAAKAFADRLGDVPLARWLTIGDAIIATGTQSPERAAAWAKAEQAIVEQRLDVAAWHVRDAVETVAYLAGHSVGKLSRSDRRAFAAAHGAAEEAALALLVSRTLSGADLQRLCAPFADLVAPIARETRSIANTAVVALHTHPSASEPRAARALNA
jgi:hypothetical protein